MKSLLVLASHPQFAAEIQAAVKPLELRVVHRMTVEESEPLLVHGLVTTCILDLPSAGVQGVWMVEAILRRAPRCGIIAFTESRESEWEEELLLAGVSHIFSKPVRERLLAKALQSLEEPGSRAAASTPVDFLEPASESVATKEDDASAHCDHTLAAMQRFSEILTHSLDATALVREFLGLLRETMGINRSAVFLNPANTGSMGEHSTDEKVWMRPVCAVGLTSALTEHLILTPEAGIGGHLVRAGRILRRRGGEGADALATREFDMVGAEVAIPIMGREEMMGILLLDRRVTGQALTNSELGSVFRLLEQVGAAITNIQTHGQLLGSNQLLGDVLKELSNACVVVGPDLSVMHANKAARRLVGGAGRRSEALAFADLPEVLGTKLYQVIKTGAAIPPFRYETETGGKSIYNVSVVPIRSSTGARKVSGNSALLVVEDRTQSEQLKELEVEAANLRLVNTMGDRCAAEINNALVPLSAYSDLFDEKIKEADFRKLLKGVLEGGVRRIGRLASQMRFVNGNANTKNEAIALRKLLKEADKEAKGHLAITKKSVLEQAVLEIDDAVNGVTPSGTANALLHCFSEIILNGYLAAKGEVRVRVRLVQASKGNHAGQIGIEFEDTGTGFTEEVARQAVLPFYTTDATKVGLGLAAAQKIIQDHGGHLEIPVSKPGQPGTVRVFLPVENPPE